MHIVWILLLLLREVSCFTDLIQLRKNVTSTLNMLLASNNYDKRIRPQFLGPPVPITVNFVVKSMGPVSENDQSYGLDCYFRQSWYDLRLRYQKLPGMSELSLSWLFLDKVWKPDTYFINGKKSYLHRITAPNKFLRLRHDGFVYYSMRLTLSASCPMYLRKFPLDNQKCPIILGSYGYSSKDVTYQWEAENPIDRGKLDLAQFDLYKITTQNETLMVRSGHTYSTLQADFWLKRHTGFFMLQVYVPCGLIVLCSWVSFWIDPDDVAARVALGVTTVLSLTTMGFGNRQQLPKVSYWTALDWFIIICFTSVFAVMIEYACVNFIDKVTKDLKKVIEKKRKDIEEKSKKAAEEQEQEEVAAETPTPRQRSVSMSAMADISTEDQPPPPSRSTSATEIDIDLPQPRISRKASLMDFSNKLKMLPKKVSTTVKELIDVPRVQDKLTKSIQNLNKLDCVFRDPDMTIPKVVISNEDGQEVNQVTVDLDLEEDWFDLDPEELPPPNLNLCQAIQELYHVIMQWKFLPGEDEVVTIMDDPDPPEKFSRIDIGSRRGFPIAFFGSLLLYLIAFAYYLTDEFPV